MIKKVLKKKKGLKKKDQKKLFNYYFSMPIPLHKKLKALAKRKFKTMKSIMIESIEKYIEKF
jgi:predicted DNA-binding protein